MNQDASGGATHEFKCPYCDACLKTGEELSKHIDQLHIGPGLLEGNTGRF